MDTDVNTQNVELDTVRRNGKLYDRMHHTFQFEKELKANIVWLFDFTDVPTAIQQYITARAAKMCATKMIGDREIYQLLTEQEGYTRAAAVEYDCNQGDYSMFGFKNGQDFYTSYQPFNALMR